MVYMVICLEGKRQFGRVVANNLKAMLDKAKLDLYLYYSYVVFQLLRYVLGMRWSLEMLNFVFT